MRFMRSKFKFYKYSSIIQYIFVMENYSFDSNLEQILSKIQSMSHENRRLIQFTKNKTKFTIIKIESIEVNNLNTFRVQNSGESNDDEEFDEIIDKSEYNDKIDEDVKEDELKDVDKSMELNQSLKRKKITKQNHIVKRRR